MGNQVGSTHALVDAELGQNSSSNLKMIQGEKAMEAECPRGVLSPINRSSGPLKPTKMESGAQKLIETVTMSASSPFGRKPSRKNKKKNHQMKIVAEKAKKDGENASPHKEKEGKGEDKVAPTSVEAPRRLIETVTMIAPHTTTNTNPAPKYAFDIKLASYEAQSHRNKDSESQPIANSKLPSSKALGGTVFPRNRSSSTAKFLTQSILDLDLDLDLDLEQVLNG